MNERIRKTVLAVIAAIMAAHIIIIYILLSIAVFLKGNNPPATSLMLYRRHFQEHHIRNIEFLEISRIPERVLQMFIAVEDPGFNNHFGIQIRAMASAYRLNRKLGYNKWGGSTITQQTARTLFLWPHKTYLRKYIELLSALSLELILDKKRILELYVNYVELGPGIFGVGSASIYHFQKSFDRLDIYETARLISILPSPIRYSPHNLLENDHLKKRFLYLINRYSGTLP